MSKRRMRHVRRGLYAALLTKGLSGGLGGAPDVALAVGGHQYYVGPSGVDGACSANSQANPFATIQHALDCAAADGTTPSSLDTIHIAAGTYNERLSVNADVRLVGSSNGPTTVDGGSGGTVVTNHAKAVEIDLLTITHGSALTNGGGIYNPSGDVLKLVSSAVTDNFAVDDGAGIWNSGTMYLNNSQVADNTADGNGSGIANSGGTMKLVNTPVSSNYVNTSNFQAGGGIYTWEGFLTLNNSPLIHNSEDGSGGAIYSDHSTVTLTNSSVLNNFTLEGNGGGLYNGNGSTMTVKNSIVKNNIAGDSYGGGIFTDSGAGSTLRLSNVTVANNTTYVDGGGIFDSPEGSYPAGISMSNTSVRGNTPDDGS